MNPVIKSAWEAKKRKVIYVGGGGENIRLEPRGYSRSFYTCFETLGRHDGTSDSTESSSISEGVLCFMHMPSLLMRDKSHKLCSAGNKNLLTGNEKRPKNLPVLLTMSRNVFQGWIQMIFEEGDGGGYWYPGVAE